MKEKQAKKLAQQAYDSCNECFDAILFLVDLEKDLLKRAMELTNKFATCNIKTEILDEQQIIQLCSSFTNMNYAYKEDSDYEDNLPMIRWEV